jgi:hypothetical protein
VLLPPLDEHLLPLINIKDTSCKQTLIATAQKVATTTEQRTNTTIHFIFAELLYMTFCFTAFTATLFVPAPARATFTISEFYTTSLLPVAVLWA